MDRTKTEQEQFWEGEFGDAYVDRNAGERLIASNLALFSKILGRARDVQTVIELGANIGLNLEAIHRLRPDAAITAVEINSKAVAALRQKAWLQARQSSLADYVDAESYDFVFTKGVLIHIHPEQLPVVYDVMHRLSKRYVCVAEYYNPSPVTVPYRGNRDRLFKRDFAGELMARFADLRLIDYGFVYRADPAFPQDGVTWFLLEKTSTG